jgi:hypothetical protein
MRVLATGLAAALVLSSGAAAWACCCAPPHGVEVGIADQDILVTWDARTKEEHFVRRAKFRGATPKDFGFLVPTPSKPELEAAPDAVFDRLATLILPEHVRRSYFDFTPLLLAEREMKATALPPPTLSAARGVTVLEEKKVAGYDAAVLEADDAGALAAWLKDHGYDARPEIQDWAEPYVAAHWKVTAFKYAGGAESVETDAIRMSFQTEGPLFPFRVPTDNRKGGGRLRVFFVGDAKVDGKLGPKGAAWNARTEYASENGRVPWALEGAIPRDRMPQGRWLTASIDSSWPSSGDDLFFKPAADPTPVLPPPIIDYVRIPVPLDVFGVPLLGIVGFLFVRRRRRAK